jgi:hypothetical protein
MSKNFAIVVVAALLAGCGFYDGKKYVLYDPAKRAAEAEAAKSDAAEPDAAKSEAAEPEAAEPEAAEPEAAEPGAAAAPEPAEQAPPSPDLAKADIDRIFLLESTLDELGRAIHDGLEPTAALIEKRNAIERELSWRKRAAGAAYDAAREQRVKALLELETQPPPKS